MHTIRKNFVISKSIIKFAFAAVLAFCAGMASAEGVLQIIEPSDGAVVRPGSIVNFEVMVNESVPPARLAIAAKDIFRYPIALEVTGGPTYTGSLTIPDDSTGLVTLEFFLINEDGGGIVTGTQQDIELMIVPDETPVKIESEAVVYISAPGMGGFENATLPVLGTYSDGSRRDIAGSIFGTTYQSSNTDVVTVSSEGELQSVSEGRSIITTTHLGVETHTSVVVMGEGEANPPAEEITDKVTISASGFRLDPETQFYVQELAIRNITQLPLAQPLALMIPDLPSDVSLRNSVGTTSVAEPIDSPILWVDIIPQGSPLKPGDIATVKLIFSNSYGKPITYQVRLFQGQNL